MNLNMNKKETKCMIVTMLTITLLYYGLGKLIGFFIGNENYIREGNWTFFTLYCLGYFITTYGAVQYFCFRNIFSPRQLRLIDTLMDIRKKEAESQLLADTIKNVCKANLDMSLSGKIKKAILGYTKVFDDKQLIYIFTCSGLRILSEDEEKENIKEYAEIRKICKEKGGLEEYL